MASISDAAWKVADIAIGTLFAIVVVYVVAVIVISLGIHVLNIFSNIIRIIGIEGIIEFLILMMLIFIWLSKTLTENNKNEGGAMSMS